MKNFYKSLFCFCFTSLAIIANAEVHADKKSYDQEEVKIAFLFRSLQYVKWDSVLKESSSSLVVCSNAPAPFSNLMQSINGRNISNLTIKIKIAKNLTELDDCNVAYIRSPSNQEFRKIIKAFQGKPVLTINDNPAYTRHGGILNFIVENNHITIKVNLDRADENNISFSAKFLRITKLIGDPK